MSGAFENVLYSGRSVAVKEYRCDGHDGSLETAATIELVFVRRGCFVLASRKNEIAVTPNEMFLLAQDREYAVRHPIEGGDECTVISMRAAELPHLSHATPVASAASTFSAHMELLDAVRRSDPLEIEETIFRVCAAVSAFEGRRDAGADTIAIARTRELIAEHFAESLPLTTIADVAGVSPFHLCRLFRRSTGSSIHQYQTRLRLRAAMVRLSGGESDISRLALDLGFSNHSHLTTAFRREFGVTPSRWRERRASIVC